MVVLKPFEVLLVRSGTAMQVTRSHNPAPTWEQRLESYDRRGIDRFQHSDDPEVTAYKALLANGWRVEDEDGELAADLGFARVALGLGVFRSPELEQYWLSPTELEEVARSRDYLPGRVEWPQLTVIYEAGFEIEPEEEPLPVLGPDYGTVLALQQSERYWLRHNGLSLEFPAPETDRDLKDHFQVVLDTIEQMRRFDPENPTKLAPLGYLERQDKSQVRRLQSCLKTERRLQASAWPGEPVTRFVDLAQAGASAWLTAKAYQMLVAFPPEQHDRLIPLLIDLLATDPDQITRDTLPGRLGCVLQTGKLNELLELEKDNFAMARSRLLGNGIEEVTPSLPDEELLTQLEALGTQWPAGRPEGWDDAFSARLQSGETVTVQSNLHLRRLLAYQSGGVEREAFDNLLAAGFEPKSFDGHGIRREATPLQAFVQAGESAGLWHEHRRYLQPTGEFPFLAASQALFPVEKLPGEQIRSVLAEFDFEVRSSEKAVAAVTEGRPFEVRLEGFFRDQVTADSPESLRQALAQVETEIEQRRQFDPYPGMEKSGMDWCWFFDHHRQEEAALLSTATEPDQAELLARGLRGLARLGLKADQAGLAVELARLPLGATLSERLDWFTQVMAARGPSMRPDAISLSSGSDVWQDFRHLFGYGGASAQKAERLASLRQRLLSLGLEKQADALIEKVLKEQLSRGWEQSEETILRRFYQGQLREPSESEVELELELDWLTVGDQSLPVQT